MDDNLDDDMEDGSGSKSKGFSSSGNEKSLQNEEDQDDSEDKNLMKDFYCWPNPPKSM